MERQFISVENVYESISLVSLSLFGPDQHLITTVRSDIQETFTRICFIHLDLMVLHLMLKWIKIYYRQLCLLFLLLGYALDQLNWLKIDFNQNDEAFILHNISYILGCACSFISYKEPNPTQPWNLASKVDNICHSTRAVMGTFLAETSSVF